MTIQPSYFASESRMSTAYTGSGGYVSVLVNFGGELQSLLGLLGTQAIEEDSHITVMYCRGKSFDANIKELQQANFSQDGHITGFEYWDGHDNSGYLVARVSCPGLHDRHQFWKKVGLTHSFDDYTPHITLLRGDAAKAANVDRLNDLYARMNEPIIFEAYNEVLADISK